MSSGYDQGDVFPPIRFLNSLTAATVVQLPGSAMGFSSFAIKPTAAQTSSSEISRKIIHIVFDKGVAEYTNASL